MATISTGMTLETAMLYRSVLMARRNAQSARERAVVAVADAAWLETVLAATESAYAAVQAEATAAGGTK